jgi:SAM-dependent methyltransferase
VLDGRPVLLDESRSIFFTEEVLAHTDRRLFSDVKGIKSYLRKLLPAGSWEGKTVGLRKYADRLPEDPLVVVIGCGFTGRMFREMFPQGRLLLSDVTLQGDADIVCAGECLPLPANSVDLVVVDQVLEHTSNPVDVVEEIYRCLKPGGTVFSGVPFYYPNHGFPFDFQRFTPLGHRLLYRKFQKLELRLTGGPFSALSLALIAFCQSLWKNLQWSRITSFLIRLCFRPLIALDYFFQGEALTTTTIAINSVFVGVKDLHPATLRSILAPYRADTPETTDFAPECSPRAADL